FPNSYVRTVPAGANPYAVALSPDGRAAYVSNWGENTLTVLDTSTGAPRSTITVGEHPSALLVNKARGELYAADTDSDQTSVIDLSTDTVSRTIDLAPYRGAPVGSNPNALALSPAADVLYVANAGADAVDVIRLAGKTSGRRDVVAGSI